MTKRSNSQGCRDEYSVFNQSIANALISMVCHALSYTPVTNLPPA
jgi:hypothetical protein